MRTAPFFRRVPVEISLLRRSLRALDAGRPRCRHCQRTPLVGERIYVYVSPRAEHVVCELCRPRLHGAPDRSELVHSPEHHRAVKAVPRAA